MFILDAIHWYGIMKLCTGKAKRTKKQPAGSLVAANGAIHRAITAEPYPTYTSVTKMCVNIWADEFVLRTNNFTNQNIILAKKKNIFLIKMSMFNCLLNITKDKLYLCYNCLLPRERSKVEINNTVASFCYTLYIGQINSRTTPWLVLEIRQVIFHITVFVKFHNDANILTYIYKN